MHNDILTIGKLTVHGYGLMIAIGILAAVAVAMLRAKKREMDQEPILDIVLIAMIGGFLGSKILYIIVEWKSFIKDPIKFLGGGGFIYQDQRFAGAECFFVRRLTVFDQGIDASTAKFSDLPFAGFRYLGRGINKPVMLIKIVKFIRQRSLRILLFGIGHKQFREEIFDIVDQARAGLVRAEKSAELVICVKYHSTVVNAVTKDKDKSVGIGQNLFCLEFQ